MNSRLIAFFTAALVAATLIGLAGQQTPADGDWPMYARDLAGTKFSPLRQITADNASNLRAAWNLTLVERPSDAGRGRGRAETPSNPEVTPIAVNGVMYLLSAGNRITALDGATGQSMWRYEIDGDSTGRGLAYWPGDRNHPARILFTASPTGMKMGAPSYNIADVDNPPARLIALDAATGKPSEGFGRHGIVEIGVPWNGVPLVFKNLIVLGATVGEVPNGPPGDTRAYDARDGKKLWDFHTVPSPGERGHDTWLDDGWKHRSGANVWAWYMTVDQARNTLYMPIAGPAANYWGGDRSGNNLFANSVVAVDATTGKYKWHFQTVHHDLWDSDMPSPPTLVDIKQNGRTIPALASVGKTGYMFILDRLTGRPIFGVEERPVPKGDVPGEWYSPTQPFPVKPPALTRVDFVKDRDMVRPEDTSADHVKACEALWEKSGGFYNAGPFTPFMFHGDGAAPKSTIQFPGGTGGVNWGGPAADPNTGFVYVNAHDTSLIGWIEKKKPNLNYGRGTEGSKQPYDRGSVNGPGPYFSFSAPIHDETGKVVANLPCQRPPWARLVAVNANTGEIAWQVPLGITEALPEGKRNTGGSGSAGPVVTAGGVVIIGAANDRRIRAFDAKDGRELWAATMPGVGNANPITYTGKNGKQYVAIVATNSLQVFALP
jgi:quinoprotein glucose dehydrogenase